MVYFCLASFPLCWWISPRYFNTNATWTRRSALVGILSNCQCHKAGIIIRNCCCCFSTNFLVLARGISTFVSKLVISISYSTPYQKFPPSSILHQSRPISFLISHWNYYSSFLHVANAVSLSQIINLIPNLNYKKAVKLSTVRVLSEDHKKKLCMLQLQNKSSILA